MSSELERHVRFLGAAIGARRAVLVGPPGADPGDLDELATRLGLASASAEIAAIPADGGTPAAADADADLVVLIGGAVWSGSGRTRLIVSEGASVVSECGTWFSASFPQAPAPGSPRLAVAVPGTGPVEGARSELDAIGRDSRELRPSQPISEEGGRLLFALASARRASRVLEIGTGEGAAAIWMASGAGSRGRVVSVERDSARGTAARRRIRRAGLEGRVDLRLGEAERVVPRLEGSFDFVLLDADVEEREEHLALVLDRCARGALIVSRGTVGHAVQLARYHATIRTMARIRLELSVAAGDGLSLALLA